MIIKNLHQQQNLQIYRIPAYVQTRRLSALTYREMTCICKYVYSQIYLCTTLTDTVMLVECEYALSLSLSLSHYPFCLARSSPWHSIATNFKSTFHMMSLFQLLACKQRHDIRHTEDKGYRNIISCAKTDDLDSASKQFIPATTNVLHPTRPHQHNKAKAERKA